MVDSYGFAGRVSAHTASTAWARPPASRAGNVRSAATRASQPAPLRAKAVPAASSMSRSAGLVAITATESKPHPYTATSPANTFARAAGRSRHVPASAREGKSEPQPHKGKSGSPQHKGRSEQTHGGKPTPLYTDELDEDARHPSYESKPYVMREFEPRESQRSSEITVVQPSIASNAASACSESISVNTMICRPSLCARARALRSATENPSLPVPTTSTRGTRKNALPLITLSDALNTVPTHRLDPSPPEM